MSSASAYTPIIWISGQLLQNVSTAGTHVWKITRAKEVHIRKHYLFRHWIPQGSVHLRQTFFHLSVPTSLSLIPHLPSGTCQIFVELEKMMSINFDGFFAQRLLFFIYIAFTIARICTENLSQLETKHLRQSMYTSSNYKRYRDGNKLKGAYLVCGLLPFSVSQYDFPLPGSDSIIRKKRT